MRLIIDVRGFVFHHAFSMQKKDMSVDPTPVVVQVLQDLASIINSHSVTELILAYDGGSQKRKAIYPTYKGNRQDTPLRDLVIGTEIMLREVLEHLPIVQILVPHIEADDIIAEMCETLAPITVMTNDGDLWQLYREGQVELVSHGFIAMQQDLPPAQHVAHKILVGDPSDNIKGVTKIGPKTAEKLFAAHGSLKNIMRWAYTEGKLGSMTYEEAIAVVRRNKRLIYLDGSILTENERNLIHWQYNQALTSIKLGTNRDEALKMLGMFNPGLVPLFEGLFDGIKRLEDDNDKIHQAMHNSGPEGERCLLVEKLLQQFAPMWMWEQSSVTLAKIKELIDKVVANQFSSPDNPDWWNITEQDLLFLQQVSLTVKDN